MKTQFFFLDWHHPLTIVNIHYIYIIHCHCISTSHIWDHRKGLTYWPSPASPASLCASSRGPFPRGLQHLRRRLGKDVAGEAEAHLLPEIWPGCHGDIRLGWRGLLVILVALEWGKSMQRSEIRLGRYHLVMTTSSPWKITIFKRETIYFYGPSIPWLC